MANKENFESDNKHTFYGISLPSDVTEAVKLVFDNMKETSEMVKRFKGSRFKAFDNINDAILFSKSIVFGKEVNTCDESQSNKNIEKILSPFNGLHPRCLAQLRKAIESDNYSTVEELIWSNPRYLVSGGDTPSILMEGPRYNACHVSAKANKHQILRLILNTVSDKKFWKLLYPFDSQQITESRIRFSLDLYLNTPCSEKSGCDTPLHLSCKWGSFETICVLLSYGECDVYKMNKTGQTPIDVICQRKGDQKLTKDIKKLFEEQLYIPLIRDDFSAQFGKPSKGLIESSDLKGEVAAVAGPMSPKQAEQLYKTLKCSPHKCTPSDRRIRLTDSRKGLERIARNLCKDMDIHWTEFWPFLNIKIDLTSNEGLNYLEKHLRNVYCDLDRTQSIGRHSFESQDFGIDSFESSKLLNRMSKLSINCSDISFSTEESQKSVPYFDSESIEDLNSISMVSPQDLDDSDSNDSFSSAYSSPPFIYDFYVNGSKITREDIDAALALKDIIDSHRCLPYDFIQNWFKRVVREEPQHFDGFPTGYSSLTSTPIK